MTTGKTGSIVGAMLETGDELEQGAFIEMDRRRRVVFYRSDTILSGQVNRRESDAPPPRLRAMI
jgi:hypothetical protein